MPSSLTIGVPREIMTGETRVALTPGLCRRCVALGARVLVERDAGLRSGFPDTEYRAAGAQIRGSAAKLWSDSDLILKVKEPLPPEYGRLREGQTLFAYLHLAAEPKLARVLLHKRILGLAYESVRESDGTHPLLVPMSQIAGRLSIQIGAQFLESPRGGAGILLGGVSGSPPGNVVVVGAGGVGTQAIASALGMGARVTALDLDPRKLKTVRESFPGKVQTRLARSAALHRAVADADLLIGAVLNPGARAPVVITRTMVRRMRPGSVIVDLAIDQGGCVEGIRPTSHAHPVYRARGINYYAVRNTPALVGHTATLALTRATAPYIARLIRRGISRALGESPSLSSAITTENGRIRNAAVANALGFDH